MNNKYKESYNITSYKIIISIGITICLYIFVSLLAYKIWMDFTKVGN